MQVRKSHWILALMTAAGLIAADSAEPAKIMMEAARKKEVVDGDLNGAIKQYSAIVTKYRSDRAVTAMALVRMAECYQKMGDAESRKIFEQVVREYADQKEAVAMARARLGREAGASDSRMSFRQVWKVPDGDELLGAVSRDGRYLPYVNYDPEHGNLLLHDLSSGTDRRLTDTGTDHVPGSNIYQAVDDAAFSRDGKQLAYSWNRGDLNRDELRLIELKGTAIPQSRLLLDNPDVAWIGPRDWSPDGKSIAVSIQRTDRTAQIGVVSVPDGTLRVLKSVDWRGSTTLVFSPDGKYIAYDLAAGDNTDQRDVFVIAADGSREIPAAVGPSQDTVVGWSNDGKHLFFASDRSGSSGLWSVPFANGKIDGPPELVRRDIGQISKVGLTDAGKLYAQIGDRSSWHGDIHVATVDFSTGKLMSAPSLAAPTYVGNNHFPVWSPDGKYLAYASRRGSVRPSHIVIAIRSVQTGEVRELTPSPGLDVLPIGSLVWAPDDRSLVVRGRDTKGRYGIFRVDAETGRTSVLLTEDRPREQLLGVAGISPDGKKLYYFKRYFDPKTGHAQQSRLWIELDLTSGSEKEVFQTPTPSGGVLSPDGRYLAIAVRDPSRLSIVPIAGGDPTELADKIDMRQFRGLDWAADSRAIYVAERPGKLWRLPIDGSEPRKVDLQWDGKNLDIGFYPHVHPDGHRIAFETQTNTAPGEVWVLENFLPTLTASK